jgi:hypothetical protein
LVARSREQQNQAEGAVPLERAPPEKQQDEDRIDRGDRRTEKVVVVVASDEFP